jgi:hypothetical protein
MYSLYIMSSKRSPKFTTTEELCDAILAHIHKKQNGEKVNITAIKNKNGVKKTENVPLPPMPHWFEVDKWNTNSTTKHIVDNLGGPKMLWEHVFTNILTRVGYSGKIPGSTRGGRRRKNNTRKNQKV